MAETDLSKYKHPTTGLIPVRMKIDEAGAGLVSGEVRGVSVDVAKKMIAAGHAEPVMPTTRKSNRAKAVRGGKPLSAMPLKSDAPAA